MPSPTTTSDDYNSSGLTIDDGAKSYFCLLVIVFQHNGFHNRMRRMVNTNAKWTKAKKIWPSFWFRRRHNKKKNKLFNYTQEVVSKMCRNT